MSDTTRIGLSAPLRVREFRYLWGAELSSVLGDQLARVALAVLVYAQTSSASLTALTYALTFVPAVLGGLLLSGIADRFPRRRVLVMTDVVRAVLAAAMAVPGLPLPVLWGLVAVLSAAVGPFKAAQLAILPQILRSKPLYRAGLSLRQVTAQTAQLVAFAAGGVLLMAVEPHLALLLNAATFVLSAGLVLAGVRDRPAAATEDTTTADSHGSVSGSVWPMFALVGLLGLYVVPEGIAAPYADELGAAAIGVGVLMAADPVGSVLGGWLMARLGIRASLRVAAALAIAAGVPLILSVLAPGLVLSVALWAVSGLFSTMLVVQIQELVVDRVPDSRRGAVLGLLATWLHASQGIAIVGGGVVADSFDSFRAVAVAGMLAVVLAGLIGAVLWVARSRRAPAGNEPNTNEVHQRSLFAIPGTSSPGPDCQTDPKVEKVVGDQGSAGDTGSPPFSATQPPMPGEVGKRGKSQWPRPDQLWRTRSSARVFLLGVEAAAIAVTAYLTIRYPMTEQAAVYFVVIVGLGVFCAEVTKGTERKRRRFSNTPHVNMSSVWTLSAALLTTPALAAATAVLLYSHFWWRSWRRVTGMHRYRAVFSLCAVVLSCHAAFALERWLPGTLPHDVAAPESILGLVLVVILYWIVNSVLIAVAISMLLSTRSLSRMLGSWSQNSLEFATLSVGAAATLLMSLSSWSAVFVLVPLFVLHRSVLVRHLEDASTVDTKTGLLNATTWHSVAATELERARQHRVAVSLIMIDVDNFERVNEAHGRLIGDRTLRAIADVVRCCVRNNDLVGRFGGEEFVIMLPGADHVAAVQVGDRIREQVRRVRVGDPSAGDGALDLHLSVSVGVALFPGDGDQDLNDLLTAASAGVFVAKDAGSDQVRAIQPPVRSRR
jgi:diguanylate cyclase (GGDEF)-like protein